MVKQQTAEAEEEMAGHHARGVALYNTFHTYISNAANRPREFETSVNVDVRRGDAEMNITMELAGEVLTELLPTTTELRGGDRTPASIGLLRKCNALYTIPKKLPGRSKKRFDSGWR